MTNGLAMLGGFTLLAVMGVALLLLLLRRDPGD